MKSNEIKRALDYLSSMNPHKLELAFKSSGYLNMKPKAVKLENLRLLNGAIEAVYEVKWYNTNDEVLEVTTNYVIWNTHTNIYKAEVSGVSHPISRFRN